MEDLTQPNTVELATELTIAWLANPNTRASSEDVPAFLAKMHEAVAALSIVAAPIEEPPVADEYVPAVSVRKSLASRDHIISMIDGKPYKALKRHLSSNGLTPDQYRERYNLKSDYPMVSEAYSVARREMAKTIGLGRKPRAAPAPGPASGPASAPAPQEIAKPKRGRPKASPKAPSEQDQSEAG